MIPQNRPEKLHRRGSGIRFTDVAISTIRKNKAYNADFSFSFDGDSALSKKMIKTTIGGTTKEECLRKVEVFLDTKLVPSEYSFITKK